MECSYGFLGGLVIRYLMDRDGYIVGNTKDQGKERVNPYFSFIYSFYLSFLIFLLINFFLILFRQESANKFFVDMYCDFLEDIS